ncbi:hypothetical protein Agub_g15507 [Astrephomene gubernaculifera]|uniref:GCK domain-containing protein n=1 Tax=Astrephomene gubernaculifera TaxID=47775 RepID=A0AAD3E6Z2_9CHLO|nr:hypothetical protein Agub_g15507 [Astrephomene gubernaculifera]
MSSGEAPTSSARRADAEDERLKSATSVESEPAASSAPKDSNVTDSEEGAGDDLSRCPICQFIEAGECKSQHQEWVACRSQAKAAGLDYIDECQDHFKTFLQCAIEHRDYYAPFLEMLGGLSEEEVEADTQAARARAEGEGQEGETGGEEGIKENSSS